MVALKDPLEHLKSGAKVKWHHARVKIWSFPTQTKVEAHCVRAAMLGGGT